MKHLWLTFRRKIPWLLLLLLVDGFAAMLLWLADVQAFGTLLGVVFLFSMLLFTATLFFASFRQRKKEKNFLAFLTQPDSVRQQQLLGSVSLQERQQLEQLVTLLDTQQMQLFQMLYYARLKSSTKDYRFEQLCLGEIMDEVLEDYQPLLE